MSWLAPRQYAVNRMLRRIAERPFIFVFSVIAAAAALVVPLIVALLLWNVPAARTLDAHALDLRAEFSVFVAPGTSSSEVKALQSKLQGLPAASEVHLVSRDEALATLAARETTANAASAITALKNNPLPDVLIVHLHAGADPEAIDAAASTVRKWPRVDAVAAEVSWWRKWTLLRRALMAGLTGVVGITIVLLAWVILSAVRIQAAADRDELRVLQLVGAEARFARRPYVYLGALTLGLAAALAACGLLLTLGAAAPVLVSLAAQYGLENPLRVPPPGAIVMVVSGVALLGGVIAALGVSPPPNRADAA